MFFFFYLFHEINVLVLGLILSLCMFFFPSCCWFRVQVIYVPTFSLSLEATEITLTTVSVMCTRLLDLNSERSILNWKQQASSCCSSLSCYGCLWILSGVVFYIPLKAQQCDLGVGGPEAGAAFLGLSPLPPEWILSSPLCLTAATPSLWQEAGRVSRSKENCFLLEEPLRETQMPPFLEPWIKAPLMVSTSTPGSESLPAWAALYFHQAPFRKKNILTQRTL